MGWGEREVGCFVDFDFGTLGDRELFSFFGGLRLIGGFGHSCYRFIDNKIFFVFLILFYHFSVDCCEFLEDPINWYQSVFDRWMRYTRAKMEARMNEVERSMVDIGRNQRELQEQLDRRMRELQSNLADNLAEKLASIQTSMQATMQANLAEFQKNLASRSRSLSHRSSASHRSSTSHRTLHHHHSPHHHPSHYHHQSRHSASSEESERNDNYSPPRRHHPRSLHHHRSTHHHRSRQSASPEGSENNSDYSPSRRHQHRDHHRYHRYHKPIGRKIDLPLFKGEDAFGWLVRMNRYFRLNQTEEEQKIDVAVVAMEDQALSWFQWWEGQARHQTWEQFTRDLTQRFQPEMVQNPLGPLFSLKQKGTVADYRNKFEVAMASQKHLTEEVLRGAFLNGLKRDVRAELKLHSARTLAAVMNTATRIEDKNFETLYVKNKEEERKKVQNGNQKWGDGCRGSSSYTTKNSSGNYSFDDMKKQESSNSVQQITNPRLSQEELLERSKKGLCFKCGENWGRGHVCKMKNYKITLMEQSEGEVDSEFESLETGRDKITPLELKTMQFSLSDEKEITPVKIFKVRGKLKWHEGESTVNVLIDGGATHNFMSLNLVEKWRIPYTPFQGNRVQLGNGECIQIGGRCAGIDLNVQGIGIHQTYYLLELGSTDLVLGMDWLTSLGDTEINFQSQTFKWEIQGQKVILQGEDSSSEQNVEGGSVQRHEVAVPDVTASCNWVFQKPAEIQVLDQIFWPLWNYAVKYVEGKMEVVKLKAQQTNQYWRGRGARMKEKIKTVAVSYHPP
ncbi:unnamed protein product [Cuscuta epithymum]|uniref:Retrotransposon gag domain-containing protein n=1 Tax=Cuscuta epithymum TaxID=186058 RepID=A0AAV0CCQ5_9ASTE|nr:unnamed protein product [Cuscuta epithymum]